MKDDLICPICDQPTNVYMGNARKDRLCRKHGQDFKNGLIEQCQDCGTWKETNKHCKCKNKGFLSKLLGKTDTTANNSRTDTNVNNGRTNSTAQDQTINDDLNCIICGSNSNGKHFCKNCYFKYKDRSVDLRITNCIETQILDEYGNLQYKCADGRKVRSRAEMIINDFLFNNKIRAVYEQTIYYKEGDKDKELHPDFFLPDYDIFLEYNELTKKSYLQSKEYAQKIYESLHKNVIIMTDADLRDIAGFLKPKLNIN